MKKSINLTILQKYSLGALLLMLMFANAFSGCIHISIDKNPADKKVDLVVDKVYNIDEGKMVEVATKSGDVKLNSWDRKEVQVKIFANAKAQEKYEFLTNQDDRGVSVKVTGKGSFLNWISNANVNIEINLPERMNTNIKTSGGDISINKLTGNVDLSTAGGDIKIMKVSGNGNVATSGGDIRVDDFYGAFTGSTSGGDINVKNFDGNVVVSTSGGDIKLAGKNGKVEASTSGGDIRLDYLGYNEGINLSTSGGDIDVLLDKSFAAKVKLSTFGGEVSCSIPVSVIEKKSSKLIGNINNGDKPLECTTMGGDIVIKGR